MTAIEQIVCYSQYPRGGSVPTVGGRGHAGKPQRWSGRQRERGGNVAISVRGNR